MKQTKFIAKIITKDHHISLQYCIKTIDKKKNYAMQIVRRVIYKWPLS